MQVHALTVYILVHYKLCICILERSSERIHCTSDVKNICYMDEQTLHDKNKHTYVYFFIMQCLHDKNINMYVYVNIYAHPCTLATGRFLCKLPNV